VNVFRNAAYNLAGSLAPLITSLLTVPAYLSLIGPSRYGALGLAWLLLGYFGVFDLGLSTATAQRVAVRRDAGAIARAETFWTALFINFGLGMIGGALLFVLSLYFFQNFLKIEDALRPELQTAPLWLGLAVPVATLSGVLGGALQGRERFLALNIISGCSSVLLQLMPLAVAWKVGPQLTWLLPATVGTRILCLSFTFFFCYRLIAERFGPRLNLSEAVHLLKFGGWVTVTSLVSPLMVIFDRFAIGALLGAEAVAYYAVPFQIAERFAIIPGALANAAFPRLSAADRGEERSTAELATRSLAVVLTPLFAAAILMIEPFLQLWLGKAFSQIATPIAWITLLSYWANGLARIPLARLQARGRPDLVAKTHLAELLPYAIALYGGMRLFGLRGAAIAFGIRVIADLGVLEFLAGDLGGTVKLLALPAGLLCIAYWIAVGLPPFGLAWFAAAGLLTLSVLVWSWSAAPDQMRRLVLLRKGWRRPATSSAS
jgi:O-antigen/teichoic acid export membrane protein